MGILEKVEGTVTLGIFAVVGYVIYKNYDTIKELWCKIPGMCSPSMDEREDILTCTKTTAQCRTELGAYGDVDLHTCTCKLFTPTGDIVPDPPINPLILPCNGRPMHYSVEEGLHCDSSEPVDVCGPEIPAMSQCYPYATGSYCNVNCIDRCSDEFGNRKPCGDDPDVVDPMTLPCPAGQVRDPLGAHLCINDTTQCMINMANGGWMTMEQWRNSPNLWENNLFLGDNGECSI